MDLLVKAGGKIASVTMFVQPDGAQECLLGTNASIPLGFKFMDGKGKPLRSSPDPQSELEPESKSKVAHVSLIQASSIHSRVVFLKPKYQGNVHLEISFCLSLGVLNSNH